MSNPWFRLYVETVDDDKLRLLAFEDRWHFIAILCCKGSGILDTHGDLLRRRVAVKLGLDAITLDEVVRRLADVGLISAKTLQPLGWSNRQFISDGSTERVRKHRKSKESGNVSETLHGRSGNGPDTDTEQNRTDLYIEPTVLTILPKAKRPAVPVDEIVNLYHQILPFGSACRKLTAKRKAAIAARWNSGDLPDLETWREYFERAAKSKFIRGEVPPSMGHKQFLVSIDYLIREDSYAKALENTGAFKW